MFVLYVKPYKEHNQYITVVIQEVVILIITYHLFCFTDWVDVDTQILVGDSV